MRVVALPGDVVDVEVAPVLNAHGVVDEAQDHMLLEHLRRKAIAEICTAPVMGVAVDVVDPFTEVRQPTGATL